MFSLPIIEIEIPHYHYVLHFPFTKKFQLYRSHVDDTSPLQTQRDMTRTDLILDPRKVQKRFRQYVDKAFKEVKLPPGWGYGGCNKPEFGGVRIHGPATMLQLVYKTAIDEYKVTVDLTIGRIYVTGINFERLKMLFNFL